MFQGLSGSTSPMASLCICPQKKEHSVPLLQCKFLFETPIGHAHRFETQARRWQCETCTM
ncbi:hypothetical protein RP20_CCG014163 [Aedes albopictus]|nr:hypothetical protein RP20_CCG014163 [Aedes albopictus]